MSRVFRMGVAPVSHRGIRYEELREVDFKTGSGSMSDSIAAIDEVTGQRLWTLELYTVAFSPDLETDVQEVLFKSMDLLPDNNTLRVVNERNDIFTVDLETRTVLYGAG